MAGVDAVAAALNAIPAFRNVASEWLARALRWHVNRVPPDCREDLLSLIVLECLEEAHHGKCPPSDQGIKELHRHIHRIATRVRRRSIDEAKRMQRVGHFPSEPEARDHAKSNTELLDLLRERLSPLDATVVAIRLEGFKLKEIAEKIGASEKTVSRILARARRTLSRDI